MCRAGSRGGRAIPTVRDMGTQRTPQSRSIPTIARTGATLAAAALLTGASTVPVSAQPGAHPIAGDPIAGDVVTCTIAGADVELVGTSGHLLTEETTHVDAQGRARSLFTVRTSYAVLLGPDDTEYQLNGFGFDRVLYPTAVNSGDVLREHILFHFDVVGPAGSVGVVRFSLRASAGEAPVITDTSTCRLPWN